MSLTLHGLPPPKFSFFFLAVSARTSRTVKRKEKTNFEHLFSFFYPNVLTTKQYKTRRNHQNNPVQQTQ